MAPQQSAKFRTAFFGQFRTSLRKDSVANYASIWTLFSTFVTGEDVIVTHQTFRRSVCRSPPTNEITRFENCGRNFAKRKQSDAEFAGSRLLRMVIIDYSNC